MSLEDRDEYPSASNMARYNQCHASYRLEKMAKEWRHFSEEDEYTESGTRIHEALRSTDSSKLISDDERNLYSKIIRKINLFLEWWGASPNDSVIQEARLWLHDDDGLFPVFSGQADYTVIKTNGKSAAILDVKTGWNRAMDPVENHQLRSLAVLLKNDKPDLANIVLQIISPYYEFRPYKMDERDLKSYEQELRETLRKLNEPSVPVTGSWCKHCRALLICPEVRKNNVSLIKLEKEADFPYSLPIGPKAAKILNECKVLEKFIKQVVSHYKILIAKDPEAVPGYCLSPGAKVRAIKSVIDAYPVLHKMIGDDLVKALSISITKVEELLKDGQTIPEDLITTRQNQPTLEKRKNRETAP